MGFYRPPSQGAAHHFSAVFHGPEEYGNVPCAHLSYRLCPRIVEVSPYYRLHKTGYIFGLSLLLAELLDHIISFAAVVLVSLTVSLFTTVEEDVHLGYEIIFGQTVDACIEHGPLVVSLHDIAEYMVDISDGGIICPEVASQVDGRAMSLSS